MYRIKVIDKISKKGLDLLGGDFECGSVFDDPDAIILRSSKLRNDDFNKNLLAIARSGVGVDNIPLEICDQNGVVVFNTPGANANGVAELVVCSLFLAARPILAAEEWTRSVKCDSDAVIKIEKQKKQFVGSELKDKTLGIIGLGNIGRLVAKKANGLGMRVCGYDPVKIQESCKPSYIKMFEDIYDLVSDCDFLSLHVPLNHETKNMIDEKFISKLKHGVWILNFSRGELVDSLALKNALDSGNVKSYITDFYDEELISNDNVIILPHLGASTFESEENCATMAAGSLVEFLKNGNIKNSINFPECDFGPIIKGMSRIVVCHKNVQNMIKRITGIPDWNVNIENMINKSKDDNAYTMVDVNSLDFESKNNIIKQLKALSGVKKVRIIDGKICEL